MIVLNDDIIILFELICCLLVTTCTCDMNVINSGTTFIEVSWEEYYDGAVYTLDVLQDGGVVLSVQTNDTSAVVAGLTPSTEYTFQLYSDPGVTKYKTIELRIDRNVWMVLKELEVYDGNGNYMPSSMFTNFSMQDAPGNTRGYSPKSAMDRTISGDFGAYAVSRPVDNTNFWKADLEVPSVISEIKIAYFDVDFYTESLEHMKLILTTENDEQMIYDGLEQTAEQTVVID